ncbi:MAG: alkaline phosphatase family protein [Gemmatimonadota bacterium]|nr:MAG: alkaline phosphatase family protein [Gemmatimonadota bacterium]
MTRDSRWWGTIPRIAAALVVASAISYWIGWMPFPSQGRSTVVLVGIDALGWDFLDKAPTPNLDRLVARGVRAERMIPIFPTKTFPNFYSIATGLYAEHHGIVANNMYDPEFDARFSLGDRDAVTDGRWWGGEPIWVTAEKQGLATAAFFWPGTEAPIQGVRPTYWKPYDGGVPNRERVAQVLSWLDLPEHERPSLVTLYFSDVDAATHDHGLDGPEVQAAIRGVDEMIGLLIAGLEERGLAERVNVIVTSDHGMADTEPHRMIIVDDYIDLAAVTVVDWNPVLAVIPRERMEAAVYEALSEAMHLSVYRKAEIPDRFHYRDHRRIPPIVAVAAEGWSISSRSFYEERPGRYGGANHGYDNELLSMGATFIAAGPAFKQGAVVPPFENVHVYELLCQVLGLRPAPNDGSLEAVRGVLRE